MDSMYMHIAAGLMMDWPKDYRKQLLNSRLYLEHKLAEEELICPDDGEILRHYNTKNALDGFLVFRDGRMTEAYATTHTSRKGIIGLFEQGKKYLDGQEAKAA